MPANNNYWIAYVANNDSNDLLTTLSFDGINWLGPYPVTGQSSAMAPTLYQTNFPNPENPSENITMVYVANNGSKDLLVTTQNQEEGGKFTWTTASPITGQSSKAAPALSALAVPEDEGILAYIANNDSNALLITTNNEGTNWTKPVQVTYGQSSEVTPALISLGNQSLLLAYISDSGTYDLCVTTSADGGATWTPSHHIGHTSKLRPALASLPNKLVMAYVGSDGNNELLSTTSTDQGKTWSASSPIGQGSKMAPALYVVLDQTGTSWILVLVWVSDSGTNDLLVTTSTNGETWTPKVQITGQSSKTAPALWILSS
jgi:hypothetical protein